MQSCFLVTISLLVFTNLTLAGIPNCIQRTRGSPYYDPNTVRSSCDRALNEIYRDAIVTGFSQRMTFRKASPFLLPSDPAPSNFTSELTARSIVPRQANITLGLPVNHGCRRGVCPLPMQWSDPMVDKGGMGCVYSLDISYEFPITSQDVFSLGQVWEVGKDLRLKCEDVYMASETIGPNDRIRLFKRFANLRRQ